MEYIAYAIAFSLLLHALGIGFTLLLLPHQLQRYSLLIAPWVGYCYASLTAWQVYYFGGRLTGVVVVLIIVPPLVCLAGLLFVRGKTALGALFTDRDVGISLGLSGVSFLVVSAGILWDGRGLTTISLANLDPPFYAYISRFLTEFDRASLVGFVGQQREGWLDTFVTKEHFGPSAFNAIANICFGTMPHQTITLCLSLLCTLGLSTVFLLVRDTLCLPTKAALFSVVLLGFHPALHYVALLGFFAQVAGMPLAVLIFWVNSKLLEPQEDRFSFGRYVCLLACLISGLLLTYDFMLPFVSFFVILYSATLAIYRRNVRFLVTCLISQFIAFLGSLALCPLRARYFFGSIVFNEKVQAGWFVPFVSPDYLLGLSYQNSPITLADPLYHSILTTIACGFVLFLVFTGYKKAKDTAIILWISCAILYLGCLLLALEGAENGILGGYKSFKLTTYFLPFFAVSIASLFSIQSNPSSGFVTTLNGVALVGLACSYISSDTQLLKTMRATGRRVDSQLEGLLAADSDNNILSINIVGSDHWEIMWEAYFLMHKKIYMEIPTYYKASALKGQYDLCDNTKPIFSHGTASGRPPLIRRLNNRFSLVGPLDN